MDQILPRERIAQQADEAREKFEQWYVGSLSTQGAREIERDGKGYYVLMQTRTAWQAWHAGWLARSAPEADAA